MKKFNFFVLAGVISALSVFSQNHAQTSRLPLEMQVVQTPSPLKETMFSMKQPVPGDAALFTFDSLNMSYQGTWGFGQSFSIGSDTTGNILFVGSGAGVIILDVSNPSSPVKLSEISTRGLVDAIYYDPATGRLYLTAYFAGFEIWDVSTLSAPVKIGGGPTIGLPRGGIFASGNYVYVVTVVDGVQVFDVSDPTSPVNTGTCPLDPGNLAWNSAKSGNLIFAALGNGGMMVVDVSNPSNPFVAGSYNGVTTGVWVANGYAYVVAYNSGLHVLDISNLSNITQVGFCQITGLPYRVQVQGTYAYLGNAYSPGGGINVVDVTVPSNPLPGNSYEGYAEHIAVNGPVLGFTGSSYPCTILDISNPSAPVLANTYRLAISTIDVVPYGNYAYTGNNGFRVFDISDKSHPVQVGYDSLDGAIVRPAGDKAVFIRESMTASNPVIIMDISTPSDPGFLGQYMAPVMTNDLEVRDHYAFVACWWDGVRVVDFQDPAHPVLAAHKMGWYQNATPGVDYCYVQALDIDGNYLYLVDYGPFTAEDTRGLYILDITDPTSPVLVSRYTELLSGGYDIDAVGDFVYVADMNGGMEVIDVTDKQSPVSRGYITLPDVANSIAVTQNHAFIADYINGGVQVVNVADPDNLVIDGYYAPSGCFALGVSVSGNDIYLADGAAGFSVYSTPLLTGIREPGNSSNNNSGAYPNPFLDHVFIRAALNGNIKDALNVYDASGRLVVRLSSRDGSSGQAVYEWNGITESGVKAKPGFYYYSTVSGSVSGKIVKVE
jgi:hypothetical protein